MAIFSLTVAALNILLNAAISFSILAFWRFNRPSAKDVNKLYQDCDGIATDESHKKYSASSRITKFLAIAVWAIGLSVSLATATCRTVQAESSQVVEEWLTFVCWAFVSVSFVVTVLDVRPLRLFSAVLHAGSQLFMTALSIFLRAGYVAYHPSEYTDLTALLVLEAVQFGAATISLLLCCMIPRRPEVFLQGHDVDGQFSAAILGRWTFSWVNGLLAFAKSNKGLDLNHLPKLHLAARSEQLYRQFSDAKTQERERLWKTLFRAHYLEVLFQMILTVVQAAVQFLPTYALYKFLELLQQGSDESANPTAWAWLLSLGFSLMLASSVETWLYWIVWARLGALIRSELSALIFGKATRRKDVKHAAKPKESLASPASATTIDSNKLDPEILTDDNDNKETLEEQEEDEQQSRQATINLIGVDTKRISDFMTFYHLFTMTATKLVISIWFLVNLIGWEAVLSGFAVFVISLPLNIYASKAYTQTQGELMSLRDKKMGVVTEALQGIRQIKFSALEQQWEKKISKARSDELLKLWKVFVIDSTLIGIWILGPVMLSAIGLAVYALIHGNLGPAVAFTTITIFGQIEVTLAIIPELVADALEAWVSLKRIESYLGAPEKEEYLHEASQISFWDASIAWPSDKPESDRFVLRNINVRFPRLKLSVISGNTGSGKSLMLAAIIGEADKVNGRIEVPMPPKDRHDFKANKSDWIIDSAMAFVAQLSYIENATIKENILFGLPFDSGRYRKVLSACALQKDLETLEDGDNTDIGANGINLSGGQRARLSLALQKLLTSIFFTDSSNANHDFYALARALYSRAGILILDDVFSAVDASVGRHLYEEALTGELCESRTRILVTHHTSLVLPKTDYSVVLAEGTVQNAGPVTNLRQEDLEEHQEHTSEGQDRCEDEHVEEAQDINGILNNPLIKIRTTESTIDEIRPKSQPKKFNEVEARETGAIKASIYRKYLSTSGGIVFWGSILSLYALYQGLLLGRAWWISSWTRSYESNILHFSRYESYISYQSSIGFDSTKDDESGNDLLFYVGVYLGISVLICVCGTCRYFFVFIGSLKASRTLFNQLTYAILRAPLRWLDTVPVGRILNRFTSDFVVVDSRLGIDVGFLLYQTIQIIGIIVAGIFVSPLMLFFAILLLALCIVVSLRFLAGAREVKRLESNCKSPIFEQFGSVLVGLGTIRGYDKVDIYIERMFTRIDEHARAYWHLWLFNRWLTLRLNTIGGCFAILVAAVILLTKGIDASLAGFALSFALQYSNAMIWAIRQYASVELAMNATERIIEYSNIVTESQSGLDVSAAWPAEGRLDVQSVVAGYAPDLPPVLKGLSLSVAKNQRVGVVGRTGAGKSSLTLALFRFLEVREGSIYIDDVDISTIKLFDLRSRLAIIPQDPVLFSGTVRSNLDAFQEHSDAELFDALERVHLIRSTFPSRDELANENAGDMDRVSDININIFKSLSSRISEGGLSLSQGQRQLLCLARAIVSRPKIMVLDEATSAVDMATDVLIQRSIREEFRDSTLLVIAHRLSTIADFDKILVMSDGQAAEFDTPKALLDRRGAFFDMVEQSGERWQLEQLINRSDNAAQL